MLAELKKKMPINSAKTIFFSIVGLLSIFLWRLYYGLSQNFWHEDVLQIYLLGLKFVTTGAWPYFGPDVIHTQQQIPGAMQSVLVGWPILLSKMPEAPFVLVGLLSLGGLCFLAHYLSSRFKMISFWIFFT